MDISAFLNQYQSPLTTISRIVLVILMSVSLAQTALFFLTEDLNQAENISSAPTQNRANTTANLDTSQIRNLFGVFQAEAAPVQENVPVTNLNLELQGIFTAENSKDSTAIVAQRGQSGQLYSVGDRLPGNAVLEAVQPGFILIKRGSRTEKLAFDDPSIAAGFSRQTADLGNNVVLEPNDPTRSNDDGSADTAQNRLQNITERIANRSRQITEERTNQAADLRSAISEFQTRLADDPETVLQELGVSQSGQGYRIGGQVSDAMLRQAGLQEGDVILSVNGQDAAAVAGNQQLMNQVMQSDRARVEVQRDQRRFVVTVPIPKQ